MTDEAIPALTFGEEVKARRTALTPTVGQAQLADMADISRNTVSNLERGTHEISNRVKRRIHDALTRLESGDPMESESELIERVIRQRVARDIEVLTEAYPESLFPEDADTPEGRAVAAMRHAYRTAARIARGEDQ
ncbi:helix-turn-helix transcriptional regulator [Nocardiopsis sp. NPDC006198]|uniref:helix-turn-helix domain-containing protein n=1 Tax=Nocardiopsis sp. NPDC006198 TaxID=3154472 RepID=UPI0033B87D2B